MSRSRKNATNQKQTDFQARIPRATFRKLLAECAKRRADAREAVAEAGAHRKQQIERYSLNTKALSDVVRLANMDEVKRMDYLRSLFQYATEAGFLDQLDAFDDLRTTLRAILGDEMEPDPAEENGRRLREGIKTLDEFDEMAPAAQ